MNIFYLDEDPEVAAIVQYNKHVVKMILESAQMLCTAHHCYGDREQKENVPYKQAHLNHPSTIWARRSRATLIEEFFFWRNAVAGDSFISTVSVEFTIRSFF